MEEISNKFRALFKSERLVYTALDETERCKDFWWKCMSTDPVVRGLADNSTPKPPARAESDKELSSILGRNPLLAVLVCLPGAEGAGANEESAQPQPIGFMVLYRSFDRCASFYLAMLPKYQNKGYGRESINWAIDYAFEWRDTHRLAINCFVEEGRIRACFYMNGSWHDIVEFGMLDSEWKQLRGLAK
ncbi:hypothetical protein K4F52_009603 [Lecanicillium sp. MT-2017a]|nr:hypothetical protein K4F52_009603 [Lecanicillium sp. MT-2017a]